MIRQHAIRIGVVCAAMLLLPSFGDAELLESETSPAIAGHAWQPGDAGCFSSTWSSVHNNCATTRKFLIPVHVTYGGNMLGTVSLSAAAENDGTKTVGPSCRGVMNDFGNGLMAQTPVATVHRGPSYTPIGALPAGNTGFFSGFNGGGEAHLDCDLTSSAASGLGLTALSWQMQ